MKKKSIQNIKGLDGSEYPLYPHKIANVRVFFFLNTSMSSSKFRKFIVLNLLSFLKYLQI